MPRLLPAALVSAALMLTLLAASASASARAWRLVTFDRTVQSADRAALAAAGGATAHPAGARSYFAHLDAAAARRLAARRSVRSVRRVRVAHKVDRALRPGAALASVVRAARGRRISEVVRLDAARTPAALARRADVLLVGTTPLRIVPEDEGSDQLLAGNHSAGAPEPGYDAWLSGIGLDGRGARIAIVDTGVDVTHPDLDERVVDSVNYEPPTTPPVDADELGHGTHVAGIVAGRPDGPSAFADLDGFLYGQGVAPGADLVAMNGISLVAPDLVPLIPTLARDAVQHGATAWNASWHSGEGTGAGYIESVRMVDGLVRDADPDTPGLQPLAMVFSAGNEGSDERTITAPKEAKNIISVGASKGQRASGSTDEMASFSSRGPALDGRILPTVTAPGESISSARSKPAGGLCFGPPTDGASPLHSLCSGTSMAAPHVAGAVALVTQWWRGFNGGATPSPAMTKALLVNSASDLGDRNVPNGDEGWGRVDVGALFATPPAARVHVDQTDLLTDPGTTRTVRVEPVDPARPLRATLAWSDAPGAAAAEDDAKERPALVNDLDLAVTAPDGRQLWGNAFAAGTSVAGGAPDRANNLENVWLDQAGSGPYTVTVSAAALPGDGVPLTGDDTDQDYALVIANARIVPDPPPAVVPAPVVEPPRPRLRILPSAARLRRLTRRRLPVIVRTSAPLGRVTVALRKGRRTIARGALARLDGDGRVTLRLPRRVRPGRYTLAASARMSDGRVLRTARRFVLRR